MNYLRTILLGILYLLTFNANAANALELGVLFSEQKQAYDAEHFRKRSIAIAKKFSSGEFERPAYTNSKTGQKTYAMSAPNFMTPNYDLKKMSPAYRNESVYYFTKEGLENSQIFFLSSKFYDKDLKLYSPNVPLNESSGEGLMVVMDLLGNIFAHRKFRGYLHHSSFFSGGGVAFAGLADIDNGELKKLFVYSGHYMPTEKELDNWQLNQRLSLTQKSEYHRIVLDKQIYFKYYAGFEGNYGGYKNAFVFHDLGILFDIKYKNHYSGGVEYFAQEFDLYYGSIIRSTALPGDISGMLMTNEHIIVSGNIEEKKLEIYQAWFMVFDKQTRSPVKALFCTHKDRYIKPLGISHDKSEAIYLGYGSNTPRKLLYFSPNTKGLYGQEVNGPGRVRVAAGNIIKVMDHVKKNKQGQIDIFNKKNGVMWSQQTKIFPKCNLVGDTFIFRRTKTNLCAINLRSLDKVLDIQVEENQLKKSHYFTLDDEIYAFDISSNSMHAYKFQNQRLLRIWSHLCPDEWCSLFGYSSLKMNYKKKKLWAMHADTNGHKVYRWDAISGKLELEQEVSFSRSARIIAFRDDKYPIVLANTY